VIEEVNTESYNIYCNGLREIDFPLLQNVYARRDEVRNYIRFN